MFDRYITHNDTFPYEKSVTVKHESFDESLNKLAELKDKIESNFIQERILNLTISEIPAQVILFSKKRNPCTNYMEYLIVLNINGKTQRIPYKFADDLIEKNPCEIAHKIKEAIQKELRETIDRLIDVSAFKEEFTHKE